MVAMSIWALVDKVPWIGELVGNDLLTGAVYVLLVGGIIVAFIAFLGCVGASREVKCMLLTVSNGRNLLCESRENRYPALHFPSFLKDRTRDDERSFEETSASS